MLMLTYQAVSSIYFCQLTLLVGGGLLARAIAAVVGGAELTAWPTAVLGIMVAAFGPPVAQTADYWGRKPFLVGLTAFGCVGDIIISRATSMPMAIAGFTIAAISCVAQPLLHAVVSEVLPRKYRSWAQATVNLSVSFGAIYGLLTAGALTQSNPEGFRTYFYIGAGLYAASAVACALLYNPPPRETQIASFRSKLSQLDWVGYCLVGSGVALLCTGLAWAQNPYPWANAHVLGPFLVGVVLLFLLAGYEWKIKKDGLFHHSLFRNRNFPLSLVCIYVEGHCAFASNYFVPFQLSVLYPSMSPFRVGLCYSVSYYAFIVFALVAGFVIWRWRSVRLPTIAGFLGFLIYFIVAAVSTTSTPEANFWGYMIFLGMGLGLLLTALVVVAQFSTPPELIAITSGLVLSVRSLGASTGLAIYQAVFSQGLSKNLVPKITGAVLPLGLPDDSLLAFLGALTTGDETALANIPGVTPEIIAAGAQALQQAYNRAFSYVWATAGACTFVALICEYSSCPSCFRIKKIDSLGASFLRDPKHEFTGVIDAPLDSEIPKTVAQGSELAIGGGDEKQ